MRPAFATQLVQAQAVLFSETLSQNRKSFGYSSAEEHIPDPSLQDPNPPNPTNRKKEKEKKTANCLFHFLSNEMSHSEYYLATILYFSAKDIYISFFKKIPLLKDNLGMRTGG